MQETNISDSSAESVSSFDECTEGKFGSASKKLIVKNESDELKYAKVISLAEFSPLEAEQRVIVEETNQSYLKAGIEKSLETQRSTTLSHHRKFSKSQINKGFPKDFHHGSIEQNIQNSAVKFFLGEKALNFQNWYHPDSCHYLLQMADNKSKCIRVTFHDANEGNNTQTFKNQLLQLVMLSNWLKRPALFVSKEPGANNHFICGLVKDGNLLLINPLGMSTHKTCYQTLAELKQERTIKEVWLSSNSLQKSQYEEEGLVSCGPIALELMTHILTNFTPERFDDFWAEYLKTDGHTTHDASGLTYYGINIQSLLPNTLKGLTKVTDESHYRSQVCAIRQKHCGQLQTLPVEHVKNLHTTVEEYLAKCKGEAPAQVVFNLLIMDEKFNINNIDGLPAYQLLNKELNTQAKKSNYPQKLEVTFNKNYKILPQKDTILDEKYPKSDKIDRQILWKSSKLLKILKNKQEALFFKEALELYIPPHLGRYVGDDEPKDAVQAIGNWLNNPDKQCLLLLGNSGAGKTLFCQWITCQIFNQRLQGRLPLFIPLLAQKNLSEGLIDCYLKKTCKIEDESQREWIKSQPLLLILDGFDEIHQKINLYRSNKLWKLKDVKIIISCRSEAFEHIYDYRSLFFPCDNQNKPLPSQLQEYVVNPFTEKQIDAYLQQYVDTHQAEIKALNPGWMQWQVYQAHIQKLPGLQSLLTSPFILIIVVQVLPEIIAKYQGKENVEQLHLTRINLYDHFVEQWFERQKQKLVNAGYISESCQIEEAFTEYSKEIAHAMLQKNVTSVEYIPKTTTPLLKKQGLFSSHSSEPNANNEDPWSIFFIEKPYKVGHDYIGLSLIRSGCPLVKLGYNQYAFLHKSLLEYFAARKLFEGVMNTASIALGYELNEKLLLDEPATLHFLAERVEQDEKFKQRLFDVLEESKIEERVQIAAANAITILNYSGVSFSGKDLRKIRILGADLSNSVFDSADLREADLRNVNLNRSVLNNANFGRAIMFGILLDQPIKCLNLNIGGTVGLDAEKEQLLKKEGAIGITSQKNVEDVLESRVHLVPYNCKQPPYGIFGDQFFITPQYAIVSLVHKKSGLGSMHYFLIIEHIEDGFYAITRADMFLDNRQKHSKGWISTSGKALVNISRKSLNEMREFAIDCSYMSWKISQKEVSILLNNLENDMQKNIYYDSLNNNCSTWCEKHLTNIGIDLSDLKTSSIIRNPLKPYNF